MRELASLKYDAGWIKRVDRIIETQLFIDDCEIDIDRLRVLEKDDDGVIINNCIPFQYDMMNNFGISKSLLTLYLEGESVNNRSFVLVQMETGEECAPINDYVILENDMFIDNDEESYKIITQNATYVYHKNCGGFSSLFDKDGNDWISYKSGGGSAGEYRGIPNLIFTSKGGTFHPGRQGCSSKILYKGPLKITIESYSEQFGFKVIWDIFPKNAVMTVAEHTLPYWFLYEGTPGGNFVEKEDYLLFPNEKKLPANEEWFGNSVPWVIFADGKSNRGLYLIRHLKGNTLIEDSYWPMEENMTVWGFGRARHELPLRSFNDEAGLKFTIGLCENANNNVAIETVRSCENKDSLIAEI